MGDYTRDDEEKKTINSLNSDNNLPEENEKNEPEPEQVVRRSARLSSKRRNDDQEAEADSDSDDRRDVVVNNDSSQMQTTSTSRSTRSRLTVEGNDGENATENGSNNAFENTSENATDNTLESTSDNTPEGTSNNAPSTPSTTTENGSNASSRPIPSRSTTTTTTVTGLPSISISFGISRTPNLPSSSSDIHWIFNSGSGNPGVIPAEINEMINSGRFANGGAGGGFVIPIMIPVAGVASGNSNNPSSIPSSNPAPVELLALARQMFQIITSIRSSTTSGEGQEFFQTLNRLFSLDDANDNDTSTSQQQIDLEAVLNEFFSRIFELSNLDSSTAVAGLSSEQISSLPESLEATFDCAICRETAGKEVVVSGGEENGKCVQLPCKHSFHFECIEPWLKRVPSCPICRKKVVQEAEEAEED